MASNLAAARLGLVQGAAVSDDDRERSIANESPAASRAPHGHLLTDHEGVVTEASSSAMELLGLDEGMLIGRALSDALSAEGQIAFKAELKRLARDRRIERWNVLVARNKGAAIVARFTVQVIPARHHDQQMLLWFIDENAVDWCVPRGPEHAASEWARRAERSSNELPTEAQMECASGLGNRTMNSLPLSDRRRGAQRWEADCARARCGRPL
jgi:PAS domain S-box-containing protein